MNDATTAIGHNAPPADADPLRDRLNEEYAGLLARKDELLAAAGRVPETIDDETTAQKASDFIKQLTACAGNAESHRKAEKEPYLAGGRAVDGYFKSITEPLDQVKKAVNRKLTAYQRQKAEEERRAREEAERLEREAAERARLEAEERAARAETAEDLDDAITAEERAFHAEADASRAERAAGANNAELSRTRGERGAVASLHTFWNFRDLDRDGLDLEALRQHIPQAALESAVRSYIKAGGRELRGVDIFEDAQSVVR